MSDSLRTLAAFGTLIWDFERVVSIELSLLLSFYLLGGLLDWEVYLTKGFRVTPLS